MSGHPPPPPPPRKPPAANKPPAPMPPAGKPPGPGQPGAYAPEPPEKSSSTGMILGIVAALVGGFIVLPMLACGGCYFYLQYKANEFVAEVERELEQAQLEEQQAQSGREMALLVQLTDRLYPLAKVDIGLHWTEPDRVRSRRWADWSASKVTDNRYAISGTLDLGIRDAGTQSYKWKCEYSTIDDPSSPRADWTLERIEIDGGQVYP